LKKKEYLTLLKARFEKSGEEHCLKKLAEECLELAQAILELQTKIKDGTKTKEQIYEEIAEEMVDINIVMLQLILFRGWHEITKPYKNKKLAKIERNLKL